MDDDDLMTPPEVAALFRVDPRTVVYWARNGRLAFVRTPGGHLRFRVGDVQEVLRGERNDVARYPSR